MNKSPVFLVFDVESIGLYGEGFAVGGGTYAANGRALEEFEFACPPEVALGISDDRKWVEANIPELEVTHKTPVGLRASFWQELVRAKKDHKNLFIAAECCFPVETRFLGACVQDDYHSRKSQAPYPLHDIATILLSAGMDPLATYARLPDETPIHNPLKDSRQSARLLSMALAKTPRFWL